MEVIILDNQEQVSQFAANYVASRILKKPRTVLGLPTGSSPLGMYKKLIEKYQQGILDFSEVITFNLDEYVGIVPGHPQSYNSYMYKNFFNFVNINPHNINIPDGLVADFDNYCKKYEQYIEDCGGIDLQILGIGRTGHIGFNEPSSSLGSRTRIKTLTESTRLDNARFFNSVDEVPHHVITMGIGSILDSKECMLIAFGEHKAESIAAMVEGCISTMLPASALQFHPSIKVAIDSAAASKLKNKEYYKFVYDNKPAWQYV
jgi:glucosamine-6-phosphate deaminase